MTSKLMTEDDVVEHLESGMTIGIGGWGARRKPMSIVRAILRSDLTDLTLATYGGPDVGMLCASGKVSKLISAFVTLDSIPLEPHYRNARQSGAVHERPMDEGMFLLALQAAAWRVPFLPTRVGLGSDLFRDDPELQTVTDPYGGEELVAVPALHLDAALVHLNRADERGNAAFLGPDLYFDDLLLEAAADGYVSCERLLTTDELAEAPLHTMRTNRMFVSGVVHAPNGAHPTSCAPDHDVDTGFLSTYAGTAKDPDAWADFRSTYLAGTETHYQEAVSR
ncbi:MAG: CoA-transferase [Acidimicrobiales bacterium]|nr:CoA-transferase [Acidimicrobiales bacterium]